VPASASVLEREVCFTDRDMELFAAASGDHSPVHTDPAFARRTAFGECIVFGGLETIALLGLLPQDARERVRTVRSSFPGPVLPGERLLAQARRHADGARWELRLTGRGKVLARVLTDEAFERPRSHGEAAGELSGEYRPGGELGALERRFGTEGLARPLLEGIGWASNVVGTTLPGFDGICTAVALAAGDGAAPAARHRVLVHERDERTDQLLIDGVLSDAAGEPRCFGTIECMPFTPTQPESPALTEASGHEDLGRAAVVVGASRGLGAALTLALLSRGYAVHSLYHRSDDCAAQLRALAGPSAYRLTLHRGDAADPRFLAEVADAIDGPLDGIAVCAAPAPLPMGLSAEIGAAVQRELELAIEPLAAFLPRLGRDRRWVALCSAAAVESPSREVPQLSVAKAAVEGLARWLADATPGLAVVVVRPARMRTDRVNTPGARAAAAAPEAVAAALAERVADERDLHAGVSILAPDLAPALAR
jgi:NAD(P)-dependent dehydrogenase (short-subunit alcohol dehydrogenase family)/acyl dehydratase